MQNHSPNLFCPQRGVATPAVTVLACLLVSGFLVAARAQSTEKILWTFNGTDGENPTSLIRDPAGNFYGTTAYGGSSDLGTIFNVSAGGTEKVLYSFTGGSTGSYPTDLIRDPAGNFYGATPYGGALGVGTIFKMDAKGSLTLLYSFTGSPDAANPEATLVRDGSGNLYGTTLRGGSSGAGTVFELQASGKENVLHSFVSEDGYNPFAGVTLDAAGNLYGNTSQGGAYGYGTLFKMDTSGNYFVLHNFTGGNDGGNPVAEVIVDGAGNLYGTAPFFGDPNCVSPFGDPGCGVVFKVDATGRYKVLHAFTGSPNDGFMPHAPLLAHGGSLYGTTLHGGNATYGGGTAFKLNAAGETILHNFGSGLSDVMMPRALIRDAAGNLYGTADCVTPCHGAIFELTFP